MATSLFDRLGGVEACRAVVDDFYKRLLDDDKLAHFFDQTSLTALRLHQLEFLKVAFTKIPDDLDVAGMLLEKHKRLFEKGLNADHFDMVASHLVSALQGCGVPPELVDEAAGVVLPLRSVFENGAEEYGLQDEKREEEPTDSQRLASGTLLTKLGGAEAVKAAVDELYTRLLDDPETSMFFEDMNMVFLKQHQVNFMKIAFDVIPDDLDVAGMMLKAHSKLFSKGLTEKHFDLVAKHLVGSLQSLNVPQELIDEAVVIVGPLRVVFEEGAKKAREEQIAASDAE